MFQSCSDGICVLEMNSSVLHKVCYGKPYYYLFKQTDILYCIYNKISSLINKISTLFY